MRKAKILIIDDEASFASLLKSFLQTAQSEASKYLIEIADSLDKALDLIDKFVPDLIITDLRLEKGLEGLAVFDYLEENDLDTPIIIVTAFGNRENLLKCIPKRPYYLAEKVGGFEALKEKVTEIVKQIKTKEKATPHLGRVKSLLDRLPQGQHFQLILDRIERFTPQQYAELEEEIPLLKLSVQEGYKEKKDLERIDEQRRAEGLIPLSLLQKGTVHCEKHAYKLKTTGERKIYTYFYLRWIRDNGKHAGKVLGKLKDIEDPLLLEKIYEKYPEFKAERLKQRFEKSGKN